MTVTDYICPEKKEELQINQRTRKLMTRDDGDWLYMPRKEGRTTNQPKNKKTND